MVTVKCDAQQLEFGVKIGSVLYDGDLNTNLFATNVTNARGAFALYTKYNFKSAFAIQVNYMQGQLYGNDNKSLLGWQTTRNLNFSSPIKELSLIVEFRPLELLNKIFAISIMKNSLLKPYAFVGIGIFGFDPSTTYRGQKIDLQSLGTEGQGITGYPDKYRKTSYSIPFGLGIKYALSKYFFISLETSLRSTLTDYIDDISQYYLNDGFLKSHNGELAAALANRSGELPGKSRKDLTGINRGNQTNDSFYTLFLSLSYRFSKMGYGYNIFGKKKVVCPRL